MQYIAFYVFSSISIFSAVMVILSKNTIKSVLFLILVFLSTAGLWILLEAEFLAIILILVYIGAVIILFLFVIMMIDQELEKKNLSISKYSPLTMLTSFFILLVILVLMNPHIYGTDVMMPEIKGSGDNTRVLGSLLYNKFLFSFELIGLIFLVGMVAVIAISFRGKQDRLSQNISGQVETESKYRLKITDINNNKSL